MTEAGRAAGLLRGARGIWLVLAVVQLLSFGAGVVAGKRNWTSGPALRSTKLFVLNRDLEYRIPGLGPWFQNYRMQERRRWMALANRGKAVPAMFRIYFDNWIVSSATTTVRTATVAPLVLFPYGRFVQGVALAQAPSADRAWLTGLKEFGGVYPLTGGSLIVVLWTLFAPSWGFSSRKRAFVAGLKAAAAPFAVAGVVLLLASYLELMSLLAMSFLSP